MKRKLQLIINGMFYGDSFTKRMLWSIFLVGVFALGSLIAGLAVGKIAFYIIAAILLVIEVYLVRSIDIGVGVSGGELSGEDEEVDIEQFPSNVQEPLKMAEPHEETAGLEDALSALADELAEKEEPAAEEPAPKKEKETKKTKKEEPEADPPKKTKKEKEAAAVQAIADYTEKDLKKTFYKYKVKRNHRPVLLDHCDNLKTKECPAYAWTHRGVFHLLLLESSPREITMSIPEASHIYYEKGYPANQKKEYDCLVGTGLIPLVFSEYKPIYLPIIRDKRQEEVKNLYRIGEFYFTAPSARELMKLLTADFVVQDEIMESEEFNQYFKQVYKLKILLDDGVLHIKDYQQRVKSILEKLSEAPITPAAFRMTLVDMSQRGLITSEYVAYYTQYNKQYRERHGKS